VTEQEATVKGSPRELWIPQYKTAAPTQKSSLHSSRGLLGPLAHVDSRHTHTQRKPSQEGFLAARKVTTSHQNKSVLTTKYCPSSGDMSHAKPTAG